MSNNCKVILTRGKNEGRPCDRPPKKGFKDICNDHHAKSVKNNIETKELEKRQCEYIGPRSLKRCTKKTVDNALPHCVECMKKIHKNAERIAANERKFVSKKSIFQRKKQALQNFKEAANSKLVKKHDLTTLNPELFEVIDYIEPDKIKDNGDLFKGGCKDIILDVRLQFLQGDMNTGKTVNVNNLIQEFKQTHSIAVFTCRITLTQDMECEFVGMEIYYDEGINMFKAKHIIISAESLHKLKLYYDIIIIDEAMGFRTQMFSMDTHKQHITANQKIFLDRIRECKHLILLDAEVNKPTLKFYQELIDDRMVIYRNIFKKPRPLINMFTGDMQIFAYKIYADLVMGKNVVFVTNGKKKGEKLISDIEKMCLDGGNEMFPSMYYTSDNPFPHFKDKDGVYNVRRDFVKYRLVAYSPTIAQGVNFDKENYFDVVYGYYSNKSNSMYEFKQLPGRIRHVKENTYNIMTSTMIFESEYFEDGEELDHSKTLDIENTNNHYSVRDNITNDYLKQYLDNDIVFSKHINDYVETNYEFKGIFKKHFLKIKHENRLSSAAADYGLIQLYKRHAYIVNHAAELKCSDEDKTKFDLHYIEKLDKRHSELVKCAGLITPEEYTLIDDRNKKYKTRGERKVFRMREVCLDYDIANPKYNERVLFLLDLDEYKKSRYIYSIRNNYKHGDISDDLFKIIMDNPPNKKYIANGLLEKCIKNVSEDYNIAINDIIKAKTVMSIQGKKNNHAKKLELVNYRLYRMILRYFEQKGINLIEDGYNNFNYPMLKKGVLKMYNSMADILGYKQKKDDDDIKVFNNIIKKVLLGWTGYTVSTKRTTIDIDGRDTKITYYKVREPFKEYKDYINDCDNITMKVDLFEVYERYCKQIEIPCPPRLKCYTKIDWHRDYYKSRVMCHLKNVYDKHRDIYDEENHNWYNGYFQNIKMGNYDDGCDPDPFNDEISPVITEDYEYYDDYEPDEDF